MISSRPRAGEPIKFVSKDGDMKSGSLTPNNIVVNSFSLQKENNVLGTFIKRKTKFSTSKVEKLNLLWMGR